MKRLGWLIFGALALWGCKRADPKETQMSGEPSRAAAAPSEPPIAAPSEPPIAAPETIPSPGAAPAAAAAAGEPRAKDTSYDLALVQPAEGAAGAAMVASVKVTPGKGYKVNEDYPTKLTLEATDGVASTKQTLGKSDAAAFDKHQLVFDVKLTPARAGEFTVRGKLSFAVCTDATCDPKTETIAINLRAK